MTTGHSAAICDAPPCKQLLQCVAQALGACLRCSLLQVLLGWRCGAGLARGLLLGAAATIVPRLGG